MYAKYIFIHILQLNIQYELFISYKNIEGFWLALYVFFISCDTHRVFCLIVCVFIILMFGQTRIKGNLNLSLLFSLLGRMSGELLSSRWHWRWRGRGRGRVQKLTLPISHELL